MAVLVQVLDRQGELVCHLHPQNHNILTENLLKNKPVTWMTCRSHTQD
jgi:hypothetical protein